MREVRKRRELLKCCLIIIPAAHEEKIPVQLEINLEVRNKDFSRRRLSCFLSFRVGTDHLYLIRDIRRFLRICSRKTSG